jgi:hypothetical protein
MVLLKATRADQSELDCFPQNISSDNSGCTS